MRALVVAVVLAVLAVGCSGAEQVEPSPTTASSEPAAPTADGQSYVAQLMAAPDVPAFTAEIDRRETFLTLWHSVENLTLWAEVGCQALDGLALDDPAAVEAVAALVHEDSQRLQARPSNEPDGQDFSIAQTVIDASRGTICSVEVVQS